MEIIAKYEAELKENRENMVNGKIGMHEAIYRMNLIQAKYYPVIKFHSPIEGLIRAFFVNLFQTELIGEF